MPECHVELLDAAWQDIDKIADFHLENVGVESARRITDTILDGLERLAEFLLMGSLHPDPELSILGYRKLVLNKAYIAVYRVIDDVAYIYRVVKDTTDYPKSLR